jgi:hypothetical protein
MMQSRFFSFLTLITVWAMAVVAQVSAAGSTDGQVYGISKQQFTEAVVGRPPGSYMVEKCVLFPVGQKAYHDRNQATNAVNALAQLSSYSVIDETGKPMDARFAAFQILFDDYPKYYAGSAVPKSGCGSALVTESLVKQNAKSPTLASKARYERLFQEQEQQFYVAALKTAPGWIPESVRNDLKRVNLDVAFAKSEKSPIRIFHDGHDWYIARSYIVEFFTAVPIRTLILFKIDEPADTIRPQIVFLNTKIGEEANSRTFASVLDVDGDGQKEILVRESGVDRSVFSLLRRSGERWETVAE